MARRGLQHLDIVVSSIERSLPLYRELLGPLGYTEIYEVVGERGEPVWYLDGEGVGASLSLREAQSASAGPVRPLLRRPPPPRLRGGVA